MCRPLQVMTDDVLNFSDGQVEENLPERIQEKKHDSFT